MSYLSPRFTISAIKDQISSIWRIMAAGFLLSLGGAGFTVLVAELTGNPIWKLAKDPAYVMRFPSYIGLLSNWSVMLWTTAAAICLFGAVILKQNAVSSDTVVFIAVSGLLNLVLAVDDLFLLHDWVFPKNVRRSRNIFLPALCPDLSAVFVVFHIPDFEIRLPVVWSGTDSAGALTFIGPHCLFRPIYDDWGHAQIFWHCFLAGFFLQDSFA